MAVSAFPREVVALSAWHGERRAPLRRLGENSQGTPCISSRQRPSTKLGVRPQQGYPQSAVHRPESRQIADFTFHTYLATRGHPLLWTGRESRSWTPLGVQTWSWSFCGVYIYTTNLATWPLRQMESLLYCTFDHKITWNIFHLLLLTSLSERIKSATSELIWIRHCLIVEFFIWFNFVTNLCQNKITLKLFNWSW